MQSVKQILEIPKTSKHKVFTRFFYFLDLPSSQTKNRIKNFSFFISENQCIKKNFSFFSLYPL